VRLDLHGIDQSGGASATRDSLVRAAAGDARVRLLPSVAPSEVIAVMAGYDLIAVPSRWQETGPLVVLEAFAAGTPVLGARLGGVAELVRDGVDGVLVAPDDAPAWAAVIEALAADRPRIEALRRGIAPPRTMDAAARDMAALYERMLTPAGR
jgi:glycosyltransferase involved in cell wall biosynthesis